MAVFFPIIYWITASITGIPTAPKIMPPYSLTDQHSFFSGLLPFFNKNFVIQYDLGLPFGTYYLRPGYVKPFLAEKLSSKGSAFWGDYYLLDSRTDLIWLLPNGNQLRLSYNWEYTQLDVLNKLQTGLHQISLSTIFRF